MAHPNPFGDLSGDNVTQITKYLKFFRQKKDGVLRSIANEFDHVKTEKIYEEMYSKDDVVDFISLLLDSTRLLTYSPILSYSLIHSLTRSLIHLLTHSLLHSIILLFTHLLTYLLTHSLTSLMD